MYYPKQPLISLATTILPETDPIGLAIQLLLTIHELESFSLLPFGLQSIISLYTKYKLVKDLAILHSPGVPERLVSCVPDKQNGPRVSSPC